MTVSTPPAGPDLDEVQLDSETVRRLLANAADRWRERCLTKDGSIFTEEPLWSLRNTRLLVRHFVEKPDDSDADFWTKLRNQLNPAPPEAKKLAAEMLWVMYLIVHRSSMLPSTKRLQVEKVWSWSGDDLTGDHFLLGETLAAGVANPGTGYHTRRWLELTFFIRLIESWKQLPEERRSELLADAWELAAWIDGQEDSKGRILRHALLFLLFPDHFEPSVSNQHKRAMVERFHPQLGREAAPDLSTTLAVDRALHEVRRHLQRESEPKISFYSEPLLSQWKKATGTSDPPPETGADELDAWFKKTFDGHRVWVIAAGEGGRLWPEFDRDGVITVGWQEIGDLSEYPSREAMKAALAEAYGVDNPTHSALAVWQFANEIEIGDHVIAKEGRSKLLGWGVVRSGYRYDPAKMEHTHVREVDWRVKGRWPLHRDRWITVKTLTDFTPYREWLHQAVRLMSGETDRIPPTQQKGGYPLDQAMEGLFIDRTRFSGLVDLLGRKMNVILQGPPGVGKTFVARRLAYRLLDAADPERVLLVQFHQAYSYEDFVQGYRPAEEGGFERRDGVFLKFCRKAAADPDRKYVLIIDEINRGNLARILGELMLLIEADKRSPDYAVPLTYAHAAEAYFHVPDNLYVLGMMNTADRSLAMVDYALRRRFAFETLRPEFEGEVFSSYLIAAGVPENLVQRIEQRFSEINHEIAGDTANLGPGFMIGHSYFVPTEQDTALDEDWYSRVVRTEIAPLLHEYWFDQPEKAENMVKRLLQ